MMQSFHLVTQPHLDTDVLLKREQFAVSLRKKQRTKKLELRRKKNYEALADNLLVICTDTNERGHNLAKDLPPFMQTA